VVDVLSKMGAAQVCQPLALLLGGVPPPVILRRLAVNGRLCAANRGRSAASLLAVMTRPITINSRRMRKQVPIEVEVTRVTLRTVSYIGVHGAISGAVPQWLFLQDFQPVTERKKKERTKTTP